MSVVTFPLRQVALVTACGWFLVACGSATRNVTATAPVTTVPEATATPALEPGVYTLVDELPIATGGLTVDHEGNVYVADIGPAPGRDGRSVIKITPDGETSLFAGGEDFLGASGNAFDSQGNLFQSNFTGNTVVKVMPDGEVSVFATEGVRGPVGIAIDPDDNLFVANCRGDSIQKITPNGESTVFAESNELFSCPNGIALDGDGNVYVANFNGPNILKVTPDGEISLFAEMPVSNNGHLVFGNGMLYLTSRGGDRIYALSLDGSYEVVAGSGEQGFEDGALLEATFSLPNGIGISPDGRILYVNHVRSVDGFANHPTIVRMIVLPE